MGPTPVYGARAEKPLQNADFAMKQTNICRLSGDINKDVRYINFDAYIVSLLVIPSMAILCTCIE